MNDQKSDDREFFTRNRYGERLADYLRGIEKITEMMKEEISGKLPATLEIDGLLNKSLPYFCKIFNSELSFIADEKRKIISSFPGNQGLDDRILPDTLENIDSLKKDEPLVVNQTSTSFHEIEQIGIHSILLMKTKFQEQWRWIGVCNGKNSPGPYLGEEKKFLMGLIRLINFGMIYGISVEAGIKIEMYSKRYWKAMQEGDWKEICRVSEDLLTLYPNITSLSQPSANISVGQLRFGSNNSLTLDDILASNLDAKICSFILKFHDLPGASENQQGFNLFELLLPSSSKNELEKLSLPQDLNRFIEILSNNYERAALAGARILLTSQHPVYKIFLKESHVKSPVSDKKYRDLSSQKKESGNDMKNTDVIKSLINNTEPPATIDESNYQDFMWAVDWLRTQWLRIYYLSILWNEEPVPNKIEEMDSIYQASLEKTVKVIRQYLKHTGERDDETCSRVSGEAISAGRVTGKKISLDSDWLMAFLAQNVLLSSSLNYYYGLAPDGNRKEKEKKNQLTKVRFFLHLSHFILFVIYCARFEALRLHCSKEAGDKPVSEFHRPSFADIPADPTIMLSDSILFIMSEYAYREIGVPRELLIFEKLRRQLNFELPLYSTSGFYRDHLYHVVDVCLLGELLFSSVLPPRGLLRTKNTLLQTMDGSKKHDFLKNWYVAALCHDLGYVVEKTEKLVDPVHQLKGPHLDKFSQQLQEGLAKGKSELQEVIQTFAEYDELSIPDELQEQIHERIISLDHGIIGWLYLCHLLNEINIPLASMRPALLAILRHNLADHDVQIHKEPLSFMLLLCDHLQEWGRPRVASEHLAGGLMEPLRFPDRLPNLNKKILLNRLFVTGLSFIKPRKKIIQERCENCIGSVYCQGGTDCLRILPKVVQKENGLQFHLPYYEAREADFEPVLSWLFFSRDFQCMDNSLRKFLFPISIHFTHKPPRIRRIFDWDVSEMDIFEEFVTTHEGAVYLCKWIEYARNHKEGIAYTEEEEVETFSIQLDKLGRPLKNGLEDSHWQEFVKWKWRWLGQKYISSAFGPWFPGLER